LIIQPHIVIVQLLLLCVLLIMGYNLFDMTFFDDYDFGGYDFFIFLFGLGACIQVVQGLGIIAWCLYLGMDYATITKEYFAAFELPPFSWNFDFSFYFDLSLWSRLFTLDLGEFELFGTSIAVQLITIGFSLLRRALVLCISPKAREEARDHAVEMVQTINPMFNK
jgi:hypothetical protein